MELKIEHLSKQFKDKTAVNDVNLTLTPGIWGLWERMVQGNHAHAHDCRYYDTNQRSSLL